MILDLGPSGASGRLSGLSRPGRPEAEFSISGRWLWDAPSIIRIRYDLEPLVVHVDSGRPLPERPEAGYLISGRLLWDAPHLIKSYYKDNDFGTPAAQRPPDGFSASAGRVGPRQNFQFRAGGCGMPRP